MEMVERLAYYGVKNDAMLYGTAPVENGGLGLTPGRFGNILLLWALFQSIVPAFTGGLSDRYGYKETIFLSTVVKISGYLTMAFFPSYWGFFAGALLLATGTAIFKPGIQGTLVNSTRRENSSMAWGVFYQTVNIGGFIGPLVAGVMRKMAWRNVFLACAAIICVNFLLILVYKEPGKAERIERQREATSGATSQKSLWRESLVELVKPHVWSYLLIFSGFWFMFNALFDVLPNHLQDWVDTRGVVDAILGRGGHHNAVISFLVATNKDGTEILPEGMLNIDGGLIMTTCFLFAALSGKMKAITSMVVGTLLATLGLFLSGYSSLGWISVVAITIFAVGEMLSSPKFSEFIGNFAPADKKAMYLGFSQMPLAIGWTLEGKIGPTLYEELGSKEVFARELLAEKGLPSDLAAVPQGKAFDRLVEALGQPPWDVTRILYDRHHASIASVWYIMGAVGIVSALGIWLYGRWIEARRVAGERGGPDPPSGVHLSILSARRGSLPSRARAMMDQDEKTARGHRGPAAVRSTAPAGTPYPVPNPPPAVPSPSESQPRTVGGHTARLVMPEEDAIEFDPLASGSSEPRRRSPSAPAPRRPSPPPSAAPSGSTWSPPKKPSAPAKKPRPRASPPSRSPPHPRPSRSSPRPSSPGRPRRPGEGRAQIQAQRQALLLWLRRARHARAPLRPHVRRRRPRLLRHGLHDRAPDRGAPHPLHGRGARHRGRARARAERLRRAHPPGGQHQLRGPPPPRAPRSRPPRPALGLPRRHTRPARTARVGPRARPPADLLIGPGRGSGAPIVDRAETR